MSTGCSVISSSGRWSPPSTAPAGRRFRLLETLRQFAAARLAEKGATRDVEARHAVWAARETARIGELLAGPDEFEGVARLDELWPNLRSALDRALAVGDVALASDLVRPVVTELGMRRRGEIGAWAERILAAGPPDDDAVLFWLTWALHRHMQSGNRAAFEGLVERYGHDEHALVQGAGGISTRTASGSSPRVPTPSHGCGRRGDDHAADLVAMQTLGSGLMTTARWDDAVAQFEDWIAAVRLDGPADVPLQQPRVPGLHAAATG